MKHKLELYFWILFSFIVTNIAIYEYATLKELRNNIQSQTWIEQAVDSAKPGTSFQYRGKTLIIREERR